MKRSMVLGLLAAALMLAAAAMVGGPTTASAQNPVLQFDCSNCSGTDGSSR